MGRHTASGWIRVRLSGGSHVLKSLSTSVGGFKRKNLTLWHLIVHRTEIIHVLRKIRNCLANR